MTFEQHLKQTIQSVRQRLAQEDIGQMRLDIEVDGRTEAGDVTVEFKLSKSSYGDGTRGGNLEAVIREFIRRHGWQQRHAPLCLPAVEEKEVHPHSSDSALMDDEIPF